MQLTNLTIEEAHKGLVEKQFSTVDLAKAALAQIKKVDEKIKAFITIRKKEGSVTNLYLIILFLLFILVVNSSMIGFPNKKRVENSTLFSYSFALLSCNSSLRLCKLYSLGLLSWKQL